MQKKDFTDIGDGSSLYMEEARGQATRAPRPAQAVPSKPAAALPGVPAALKLAEGTVRYAGQQVAAVAAVDERTAEKALALIKVEYKTLPYVVDWERGREASGPPGL